MSDSINIKCGALGNRAEMPKLAYDKEKGCELGYRTDEMALYIGTVNGNARLCGANDVSTLTTEINNLKNAINDILARLGELENPTEPSE